MEKGVAFPEGWQEKALPWQIFIRAGAEMIATMTNVRILESLSSACSSASFCKFSGQTKENCVPPRTDSKEVIFSSKKIRCLLADDHVLLRQGLRRLLEDEPDIDVVGEAGNAAECLRKVYELRPDVLVADTETFGLPAVEAELLVARESPETKIVFLSMQDRATSPFEGLRAATGGCAVPQTSVEELVEMVRNSRRRDRTNDAAVDGIATSDIATKDISTNPLGAYSRRNLLAPERALTGREREVLKLLAEGKTVRAAATVLGLSSKTVDAHKFNLMRKLGIHNKAELVMWAIQKRVVKIPANF
jgi:two-component system, NarL family, response regulator NreC